MTTRRALLKLEKGSYDDMASGGKKCQQEDSRGKESGRRKRWGSLLLPLMPVTASPREEPTLILDSFFFVGLAGN